MLLFYQKQTLVPPEHKHSRQVVCLVFWVDRLFIFINEKLTNVKKLWFWISIHLLLRIFSGSSNQPIPQGYALTAPLSDAELTALLMASPLYQKLEQIKKAVSGGAFKVGKQLKEGMRQNYISSLFEMFQLCECYDNSSATLIH